VIARVENAIRRAEAGETKLSADAMEIWGQTSNKVRIFLNELCSPLGHRHLEIGTWRGATLIAASQGNVGAFVGIDNFSQFGGPAAKDALTESLDRHPHRGVTFVEGDCFGGCARREAFARGPFDSFFYDGLHGRQPPQEALRLYRDALARPFVWVLDDFNQAGERQAWQGIQDSGQWTIRWSRHLPADGNGDKKGWWNGLLVAVMEAA